MTDENRLAAEQRARVLIDRQLSEAGWAVQDRKVLNLFAGHGVAVREVIMAKGHGRADYLLYVDQKAVGVIEAKPAGTTLSGVEWQSAMYAEGLPAEVRLKAVTRDGRLPFVFEASGSETHFTNGYDPNPRARRVFAFPQPATLARTLRDTTADPHRPTWRGKVAAMPELDVKMLRPAQITAIGGIERSLAEQRFDRSLVQMATGAGKTFAAVTAAYRLLKHGGFNRVLFLVDRNNLADQTLAEFRNYRTPGDGRRFTEIYHVDKLTGAGMLGSSKVVISTIQRVHRALSGNEVADADDPNLDDFVPAAPVTVFYNKGFPPETFDLVIVDEAHRSIYGMWRAGRRRSLNPDVSLDTATGCLRRTRHRGEPLLRLGPLTHPEEDAFASPGAAAAGTTSRRNGRELGGVPSGWRCASVTATCAVVGRQLVTKQRCTDRSLGIPGGRPLEQRQIRTPGAADLAIDDRPPLCPRLRSMPRPFRRGHASYAYRLSVQRGLHREMLPMPTQPQSRPAHDSLAHLQPLVGSRGQDWLGSSSGRHRNVRTEHQNSVPVDETLEFEG